MARTPADWSKHHRPYIAAKIWALYYATTKFEEQPPEIQTAFLNGVHIKFTTHEYGKKGGLQKGHSKAKCFNVSKKRYMRFHDDARWCVWTKEWQWREGGKWIPLPTDKVLNRSERKWVDPVEE